MAIILILGILLIIAWLIAEFKMGKAARIILGLATVAIVAYFSTQSVLVIPYYERGFHKACIKKVEEYIQKNNIDKIKEAINSYNKIILETDNSYKAAMEMWGVLMKEETNPAPK